MKKLFIAITIVLGVITFINAQGITNTLGGDSSVDKFQIKNFSGLELLTVTGDEKVGIGTAQPAFTLDVNGTAQMTGFMLPTGQSLGYVLTSNHAGYGTWQPAPTGGGSDNDWTISGDDQYSSVSGNVGIGTTSPLSKLSVGGDGESNSGIYGEANGSSGRGVYGYASNGGSVTNYGGYFEADGYYGRGVHGYASNSEGINNYGGYFEAKGSHGRGVYGSASGSHGRGVHGYASGGDGRGVYGYASNGGSVNNYGGYFEAKGTDGRGVYGVANGSTGHGVHGYSSGSIGVGVYGSAVHSSDFWAAHGTYGNSSSIRWKSNIVEIDKPLEKLAEIRGVYFDWDEEHGGGHTVGMIAEEVGKVLPEIVFYEENGIDAKGMDYSKLTPLLVEAIKALQKRVEELENK